MNDIVAFIRTKEGRRAVEVFTRQVAPRCQTATRGLVQQATVGCRWWQLVYAILVSLPYPLSTLLVWSKGLNHSSEWKQYQEMIGVAQAIIRQIEAYRWSSLYSILYRNRPVECPDAAPSSEPCLRRMDASFVDSATDGRYYTCLYTENNIGHYFVIERRRPSWYLSSSYGSEWVRVPVQTQEVPEDDLREWIDIIGRMGEESEEERRILERFYIHYFLEGGLPMSYSQNTSKGLQGRPIPSEVGIAKEVEIALDGPLHIGYIESMEEHIQGIVESMVGNVAHGGLRTNLLTRRRRNGVRTKRERQHRLMKSRRNRRGRRNRGSW